MTVEVEYEVNSGCKRCMVYFQEKDKLCWEVVKTEGFPNGVALMKLRLVHVSCGGLVK